MEYIYSLAGANKLLYEVRQLLQKGNAQAAIDMIDGHMIEISHSVVSFSREDLLTQWEQYDPDDGANKAMTQYIENLPEEEIGYIAAGIDKWVDMDFFWNSCVTALRDFWLKLYPGQEFPERYDEEDWED